MCHIKNYPILSDFCLWYILSHTSYQAFPKYVECLFRGHLQIYIWGFNEQSLEMGCFNFSILIGKEGYYILRDLEAAAQRCSKNGILMIRLRWKTLTLFIWNKDNRYDILTTRTVLSFSINSGYLGNYWNSLNTKNNFRRSTSSWIARSWTQ